MSALSFAVVLPARYNSTRFPGKPLAMVSGKPLIEWVYQRARSIRRADIVLVATDDDRIEAAVGAFGGSVVRTRADHATGTDRVAEVARTLSTDVVVNLQGDEPVFDPQTVEQMVDQLGADAALDITTACHPITDAGELNDPNVVKVVFDRDARALYFSRAAIPHGAAESVAHRHVGIYAFRTKALLRFAELPRTALERSERLEQLRALEYGMKIGVVMTPHPTVGVDVPDDIKTVEKQIGRH